MSTFSNKSYEIPLELFNLIDSPEIADEEGRVEFYVRSGNMLFWATIGILDGSCMVWPMIGASAGNAYLGDYVRKPFGERDVATGAGEIRNGPLYTPYIMKLSDGGRVMFAPIVQGVGKYDILNIDSQDTGAFHIIESLCTGLRRFISSNPLTVRENQAAWETFEADCIRFTAEVSMVSDGNRTMFYSRQARADWRRYMEVRRLEEGLIMENSSITSSMARKMAENDHEYVCSLVGSAPYGDEVFDDVVTSVSEFSDPRISPTDSMMGELSSVSFNRISVDEKWTGAVACPPP
jgi:hypothetical protein